LRSADGTVTIFGVPGASPNPGTLPRDINPSGEIVGVYSPGENYNTRGFVRSPKGTITTLSPSGAVVTDPLSINASGEITGWYVYEGVNPPGHGFILSPGGTLTSFDFPDPTGVGTYPQTISSSGEIAGYYLHGESDGNFVIHAFVRKPCK